MSQFAAGNYSQHGVARWSSKYAPPADGWGRFNTYAAAVNGTNTPGPLARASRTDYLPCPLVNQPLKVLAVPVFTNGC